MTESIPHVLRQCDLARLAGVNTSSARRAFHGKLTPALTEDKRRVYSAHPLVHAYIHSNHGLRKRAEETGDTPAPAVAATLDAPTDAEDPFKVAMANAATPKPSFNVGALRKKRTDAVLFDLHTNTAGQMPADVEDLGAMTLREAVDIFGGLQALADAVKAQKYFAELKLREVETAKKRGVLVDRKLLTVVLMPLIELAFKRLVGEVPMALTERLVARVISGGVDMKNDVENLMRDEIGGVLESMRDSVVIELQKIEEESHV